jgi:hypothetical protein
VPAPNIATLYDFEGQYETALRNYFANMNVNGQTFGQVVTPQSNLVSADHLTTPRLQVRVSMTGLGADGSGYKEDFTTSGNLATNYYSHYTAQLTLDVVSSRSNTSQSHGLLRGATRQAMLEATAIMNNTTVPYYQTVFVTPTGSAQGIDEANDEIQTQLSYALELFIPPSSYPNA